MKDRSELEKIHIGETRVVLTRDLSIMNQNLVPGAQGLAVGMLANYTLKVAFPRVTVGISYRDCEIVEGAVGMPTDAEQPKAMPRPRAMGEE
jgi:hypothetical protein